MATNMVRWDPFREMMSLREAMDSLFENALITPFGGGQQSSQSAYLPLDVTENDDSFVVKASLPGVNPEDMEITVNGDVLTIKGEIKQEQDNQNERYHVRERRWGTFARSVSLPTQVKTDAVEAEYRNGVLMLTLPKADDVRPKRIAIKGDQQRQNQQVLEGQATQK